MFVEHLGDCFCPPDFLDGADGLNTHMYLGHLLHQACGAGADDLLRRVADLVDALHFDGDEACRELVHVSFFENMDHRTNHEVAAVYATLSPRMRKVMLDAFQSLGYEL